MVLKRLLCRGLPGRSPVFGTKPGRVSDAEADEARGPVDVGFLGSHRHVLEADGATEGVEEMLWAGRGIKK